MQTEMYLPHAQHDGKPHFIARHTPRHTKEYT
jgi:hypothetical protein